jgi:hypothetical protein
MVIRLALALAQAVSDQILRHDWHDPEQQRVIMSTIRTRAMWIQPFKYVRPLPEVYV